MTKLKNVGFLVLLAVLAACASEDVLPEGASLEVNAKDLGYELVDPAPMSATVADPGIAPAADEISAQAVNCVTVKWCNEPGPRKTVCKWHKTRPGCNDPEGSGAIAECVRDALHVCGYVSDPFHID